MEGIYISVIDYLKINSFAIQFRDKKELDLMVISANIPGFTLGQLEMGRPVVKDKRPGDSLEYNDLTVQVVCDEDLQAFTSIYTSLVQAADPNTGEISVDTPVFDCYLFLTTNKNNIQKKVHFYNAFFKAVSDLQFESTTTEGEQLNFSIDLGYSFYNFEDV